MVFQDDTEVLKPGGYGRRESFYNEPGFEEYVWRCMRSGAKFQRIFDPERGWVCDKMTEAVVC